MIARNFGLSEDHFHTLREQLIQGDESLFEQVFLARFGDCMSFLKSKYRASHADAYDAVMDAMLRFRQILIAGQVTYGNLEAYLMRMSITQYLRSKGREKEIPAGDLIPDLPDEIEDSTLLEFLPFLDQAWKKLGEPCSRLLKGFYYDQLELKQLTDILGDTSEANTRKRKQRCVEELRRLFFMFAKK